MHREWDKEDILDLFHLIRVVDDATEGDDMASRPAELAVASAFTKTNDHYTYTLDDDNDADNEDIQPEEDNVGREEGQEKGNEEEDNSGDNF